MSIAPIAQNIGRKHRRDESDTQDGPRTHQQEDRRPLQKPKREFSITLKGRYISYIKSGVKTVEGRINVGQFCHMRSGDTVRFFNQFEAVTCSIQSIKVYRTFKEMLETEGLAKVLPETRTVEDGVRLYESFPRYKENAARFGVAAIRIQKI